MIDFTARLFGLKPGEAARKLADDFGIQYDRRQQSRPRDRPSVLSKLEAARQAKEKEMRCFRVLCHYVHLMRDWKENLAPKVPEEDWHPLFCEALRNIDYYQYLLDTFIEGTPEERTAIVKDQSASLDALEKRVSDMMAGQSDEHISYPRRREPAGHRDGRRVSSISDRAV